MTGRFIALEGIDGSGKSTLARSLAAWLPGSGLLPAGADVVLTHEPGATQLGLAIRQLVLTGADGLTPRAELLLFAADRAQHVATVIEPALKRGDWVVCDRYTGSTVAYQGYGRGQDLELIDQINKISSQGVRPDLNLLLMLKASTAASRCKGSDRFERLGPDFMTNVNRGYTALLKTDPSWSSINASLPMEEVRENCFHLVRKKFEAC